MANKPPQHRFDTGQQYIIQAGTYIINGHAETLDKQLWTVTGVYTKKGQQSSLEFKEWRLPVAVAEFKKMIGQ